MFIKKAFSVTHMFQITVVPHNVLQYLVSAQLAYLLAFAPVLYRSAVGLATQSPACHYRSLTEYLCL